MPRSARIRTGTARSPHPSQGRASRQRAHTRQARAGTPEGLPQPMSHAPPPRRKAAKMDTTAHQPTGARRQRLTRETTRPVCLRCFGVPDPEPWGEQRHTAGAPASAPPGQRRCPQHRPSPRPPLSASRILRPPLAAAGLVGGGSASTQQEVRPYACWRWPDRPVMLSPPPQHACRAVVSCGLERRPRAPRGCRSRGRPRMSAGWGFITVSLPPGLPDHVMATCPGLGMDGRPGPRCRRSLPFGGMGRRSGIAGRRFASHAVAVDRRCAVRPP